MYPTYPVYGPIAVLGDEKTKNRQGIVAPTGEDYMGHAEGQNRGIKDVIKRPAGSQNSTTGGKLGKGGPKAKEDMVIIDPYPMYGPPGYEVRPPSYAPARPPSYAVRPPSPSYPPPFIVLADEKNKNTGNDHRPQNRAVPWRPEPPPKYTNRKANGDFKPKFLHKKGQNRGIKDVIKRPAGSQNSTVGGKLGKGGPKAKEDMVIIDDYYPIYGPSYGPPSYGPMIPPGPIMMFADEKSKNTGDDYKVQNRGIKDVIKRPAGSQNSTTGGKLGKGGPQAKEDVVIIDDNFPSEYGFPVYGPYGPMYGPPQVPPPPPIYYNYGR